MILSSTADVDVGKTLGPTADGQAEADKRIAQAKADERGYGCCQGTEMLASVQEMRAKVVEAEAEIPRAFQVLVRAKQVMDYYNMQNIRRPRCGFHC